MTAAVRRRPWPVSCTDPESTARLLSILSSMGCVALVSEHTLTTDAPESWVRVAAEAVIYMRERDQQLTAGEPSTPRASRVIDWVPREGRPDEPPRTSDR
jgi:hypothetical protein